MTKPISDHNLLVRIDERQKGMAIKINDMADSLDKKVDDDKEYRAMVGKVENLWDSKNKLIGWMLGAGITGGAISSVVGDTVRHVLASFK